MFSTKTRESTKRKEEDMGSLVGNPTDVRGKASLQHDGAGKVAEHQAWRSEEDRVSSKTIAKKKVGLVDTIISAELPPRVGES